MASGRDGTDWTWVVNESCPDCGFDPEQVSRDQVPLRIREACAAVAMRLGDSDAADRPGPAVWSPLEYGCHVRDVCDVMAQRADAMVRHDEPTFADWDQEQAALEGQYSTQLPAQVADEVDAAALRLARVFQGVADEGWDRIGHRSDGHVFTVWTLGLYALHEVDHHAWDVTGD